MRPRSGEEPPPGPPTGDRTVVTSAAATPVVPPAPPSPTPAGGGAHAGPPAWDEPPVLDPDVPTRATKAGLSGAVVALGAGLLGAAVVVSVFRSRTTDDGDLDWSVYGSGLAATAGLLFIALVGSFAARRAGGRAREEVITWPGTVGILATAAMIMVGINEDEHWVGYLVGGVVVALSFLGYLAARRAAFVVTAILGLVLIYGLLFDDLVADSIGDEHELVITAAVIAVFVLIVTLLGWLLPTRATSGVVVGVMGLVGFVGIFLFFIVTRFLSSLFGGFALGMGDIGTGDETGGIPGMPGMTDVDNGFVEADVWWVLALAGLLTVVWALAASITNHPGFSILAIAMPAITVPLASVALAAEHPTWWSVIAGGAGGVLLLGGLVIARARGKSTAREAESPVPA